MVTTQTIEMQRIKIKPSAPDVLVRKEDGTGMLSADGERVPLTTYYRRRLMDGDVIEMADDELEEVPNEVPTSAPTSAPTVEAATETVSTDKVAPKK